MKIRFIGDVHGRYPSFLPLLSGADAYVQVGDMGLEYGALRESLAPDFPLSIVAGNHDNYDENSPEYFRKQPWFLGDYGTNRVGSAEFFYVRGAWSIDWKKRYAEMMRGEGVSWWEEEQLGYAELMRIVDIYEKIKPDFMITHECPHALAHKVTNPEFVVQFGHSPGAIKTRTNMALQMMLEAHRPKLWIFGHFHRKWSETINGTRFVCLDMINGKPANKSCYLDLEF